MTIPIRIAIADDHLLFRQGLKSLLRSEPEVVIVGEADRVGDVPMLLDTSRCAILLLDLQMEHNTLADVEELSQRVQVVILTASEALADAMSAIRKGARAVVFKRFAVETLMGAIRTVACGQVWLPATLQTQMAERMRSPAMSRLSAREEEIVRCVGLGLRNAEIARDLGIGEETVKTHLTRIFRKLGMRDRVELALHAARNLPPSDSQK